MSLGCCSEHRFHLHPIRQHDRGLFCEEGIPAENHSQGPGMVLQDASFPSLDRPSSPGVDRRIRFDLGRLCVTATAMAVVPAHEIVGALARHARGDWGTLAPEDWEANDCALREGGRLLSVYHTAAGVKFYVITERDRSRTTTLLPEDY